jgi:chromosome segregation ATPase
MKRESTRWRSSLNVTSRSNLNFILELKTTVRTHESTIIELREIITQKTDVEDQLASANGYIRKLEDQKTIMQRELETASDYILELEDKVYKANKTSLELLRQLKDAEVEIETLKNYIIELK